MHSAVLLGDLPLSLCNCSIQRMSFQALSSNYFYISLQHANYHFALRNSKCISKIQNIYYYQPRLLQPRWKEVSASFYFIHTSFPQIAVLQILRRPQVLLTPISVYSRRTLYFEEFIPLGRMCISVLRYYNCLPCKIKTIDGTHEVSSIKKIMLGLWNVRLTPVWWKCYVNAAWWLENVQNYWGFHSETLECRQYRPRWASGLQTPPCALFVANNTFRGKKQ